MHFSVISLMPDWIKTIQDFGVVGKAFEKNLIQLQCINPRDFTTDKYQTVDDRPYGGGPGMVMKSEPLALSIESANELLANKRSLSEKNNQNTNAFVIYLSPQGRPLTQNLVKDLSKLSALTLIAGRYEGVDERLIQDKVDLEISVGDYVLSGGELPAMILIDAIARLLPEVLGHSESAAQDSFSSSHSQNDSAPVLDHPHFTRPEKWREQNIPTVLNNGDHAKIAAWRDEIAHKRTWQRRPEQVKSRAD